MTCIWEDTRTATRQFSMNHSLPDNPQLSNTRYTQLRKVDIHLVRDISDVGTDEFLDWAGFVCFFTSRPFYYQIDHLHEGRKCFI